MSFTPTPENREKIAMVQTMSWVRSHIKDNNRSHGRSNTPEYTAWAGMKTRCYNPNHISFPDYGGRGIKVCEGWLHNFQAFFDYIGPRPSPLHSVDREDVNGNYEPGNVRWATPKEQGENRRRRKRIRVFLKFTDDEICQEFLRRGLNLPTLTTSPNSLVS